MQDSSAMYEYMEYALADEDAMVLSESYRVQNDGTYPALSHYQCTYWRPYGEATSALKVDSQEYVGAPELLPYEYPLAFFSEVTHTFYFPDTGETLVLHHQEYNESILWAAPPVLK